VPAGYIFNTDGTSLYMTMTAFVPGPGHEHHLTLTQQLAIFAVATLTSKGASGVQGASFIALVGHFDCSPNHSRGGHGFGSRNRPFYEHVSRGGERDRQWHAALVVARWEKEVDRDKLRLAFD
jgi:aerobic C4-dicarboxylate transport protein